MLSKSRREGDNKIRREEEKVQRQQRQDRHERKEKGWMQTREGL